MYLIIVGAGDIGAPLVELATQGGNEVVVIEQDPTKANDIATRYDCMAINEDATVKETIVDAGAQHADALISTTDKDAINVMVCLLGQELGIPSIISVVHNPDHMGLFSQIGVNTMENPQRLIAEYLYRGVKRPTIVDFMQIGERAEVFEIVVTENAPIAGSTLQEANDAGLLFDDMLIVAIERANAGAPITPRGETTILEGDILTVYSGTGATPEVTDVFGHYEDHASDHVRNT